MRVLVLGATGFIGQPVAQALSRAGYVVYGQTRTPDKAKLLAVDEIIPVVGDPLGEACLSLIATLDVVIAALGGLTPTTFVQTIETYIIATQTRRPPNAPKLTYIQTSGTWAHGDNRKDIVTDGTPVLSPTELTRFLPEAERLVINAQVFNGIVIRPSMVYGRSGSITSKFFADAVLAKQEGRKLSVPGTPGGRWGVIHQDDLADLYVRAASRAPILKGLIIDASSGKMESVDDVMTSIAQLVGIEGYEYRPPLDLYEASIASSALVRPYLPSALLDWHAKKPGLVDGLATYFAAYLASL